MYISFVLADHYEISLFKADYVFQKLFRSLQASHCNYTAANYIIESRNVVLTWPRYVAYAKDRLILSNGQQRQPDEPAATSWDKNSEGDVTYNTNAVDILLNTLMRRTSLTDSTSLTLPRLLWCNDPHARSRYFMKLNIVNANRQRHKEPLCYICCNRKPVFVRWYGYEL